MLRSGSVSGLITVAREGNLSLVRKLWVGLVVVVLARGLADRAFVSNVLAS